MNFENACSFSGNLNKKIYVANYKYLRKAMALPKVSKNKLGIAIISSSPLGWSGSNNESVGRPRGEKAGAQEITRQR
jgi:hypothetical protein